MIKRYLYVVVWLALAGNSFIFSMDQEQKSASNSTNKQMSPLAVRCFIEDLEENGLIQNKKRDLDFCARIAAKLPPNNCAQPYAPDELKKLRKEQIKEIIENEERAQP